MRKIIFLGIFIFLTGNLSATTYRLFIHGRSGSNHCKSISSVSDATSDYNNYWGGTVSGLSNVRYVGFDGTKSGGAYSWSSCGAQSQLYKALQTFCRGSNSCEIYTHSTGGLVAAAYFAMQSTGSYNVSRIQLMANASGGSELADLSSSYLSGLGFDTTGGELDNSVSTSGARNGFNHNNAGGMRLYTTGGEGTDYAYTTSPFLPGKDDGVLANHSLCNINKVGGVDKSCSTGSGRITDSYSCGWLWQDTCYEYWYRWSPYYTVYRGGSGHSHSDAKSDYNRR